MQVRVGTSGYAYKEWKGSFYPEKLASQAMLGYYAERFRTVEINNTFYRMPSESVLAGWAAEVPDDFRFVLKASRRITHMGRLLGVEDPVRFFLERAALLGSKLGPLLFQLPPNLPKNMERLEAFLALVPQGTAVAMEFRHPSWHDDEVQDALRRRDVALCLADSEDGSAPLVATARYGYLRLRRAGYETTDLTRWASFIREQAWDEAYVFFKHEDAGAGPRLAAALEEILGETPAPSAKRPAPAPKSPSSARARG